MPKVYVVSDSGHDYSKAWEHGEVVFLLESKVNVFAIGKLVRTVEEKLAGARPEDYLVLSGSSVGGCLAFHSLLERLGRVQLLIFSFRDQRYEVRTVSRELFMVAPERVGGTDGGNGS